MHTRTAAALGSLLLTVDPTPTPAARVLLCPATSAPPPL